jgi:hypothetical protein
MENPYYKYLPSKAKQKILALPEEQREETLQQIITEVSYSGNKLTAFGMAVKTGYSPNYIIMLTRQGILHGEKEQYRGKDRWIYSAEEIQKIPLKGTIQNDNEI